MEILKVQGQHKCQENKVSIRLSKIQGANIQYILEGIIIVKGMHLESYVSQEFVLNNIELCVYSNLFNEA